MADKIGVLGEATTVSIATTTVYTVPAAKAAKCQIMWSCTIGSDSSGDLTITVNGVAIAVIINMTANNFVHSNTTLMVNPETAAAPTGATALLTVAPAPMIYYLSAADTVTYTVATTAVAAINIQVVGTEIDV